MDQNLNSFAGDPVHYDVRLSDEFASALHFSGSAEAGKGRELFNPLKNLPCNIPSRDGIVLMNIFDGRFELAGRFGGPPNPPHG